MTHYKIGIPQLTWVYVEVEVDPETLDIDADVSDEYREEIVREAAIEKAYAAAPRSLCASCDGWGQEWNREVDELGSLVDGKVTLELDIVKQEGD